VTPSPICLVCGAAANVLAGLTAELQVACSVCGAYGITGGAINAVKNPRVAATARAAIRTQHKAGEVRPMITLELIRATGEGRTWQSGRRVVRLGAVV
jgi:hypothetical protein